MHNFPNLEPAGTLQLALHAGLQEARFVRLPVLPNLSCTLIEFACEVSIMQWSMKQSTTGTKRSKRLLRKFSRQPLQQCRVTSMEPFKSKEMLTPLLKIVNLPLLISLSSLLLASVISRGGDGCTALVARCSIHAALSRSGS